MKLLPLLLLVSCLSLGCGSHTNSANTPNALQAILNGPSLAGATSYWACEACVPGFVMGVEFAADGSFQTIITGSGPGSTTCTGTVSYPPNQPIGTQLILGGSCSNGTDSIETMSAPMGSTSSGGLFVTTTRVSMNQDASYEGCSFTLVQGKQ